VNKIQPLIIGGNPSCYTVFIWFSHLFCRSQSPLFPSRCH